LKEKVGRIKLFLGRLNECLGKVRKVAGARGGDKELGRVRED
jgi:hypothetical protein